MSIKYFIYIIILIPLINFVKSASEAADSIESFLKQSPFEKPVRTAKKTVSPYNLNISLGYYAQSEGDYFRQTSSHSSSAQLAGYIGYVLTHDFYRLQNLENLFYCPKWQKWKEVAEQAGERSLSVTRLVEVLDETKRGVLQDAKGKLLSIYKVESYIPALIDQVLKEIYLGCWGFSDQRPSDTTYKTLRRIFHSMTVSYKSHGGYQETLTKALENSQRNYRSYSEHFNSLNSILQQAYLSSSGDFREGDVLTSKITNLTILGVAQKENLNRFIPREVYKFFKTQLPKSREFKYFLSYLRRFNLTLESLQAEEFLDLAKTYEDGFLTFEVQERRSQTKGIDHLLLKEDLFKIDNETLQSNSSILYNLLKKMDLPLSEGESNELLTRLDFLLWFSEEQKINWIGLLKNLYKSDSLPFEDFFLNCVEKNKARNLFFTSLKWFKRDNITLPREYIIPAVFFITSLEDTAEEKMGFEKFVNRRKGLINEISELINSPEDLSNFGIFLALETLEKPYLSMCISCLQWFNDNNQKLSPELWNSFKDLFNSEKTKALNLPLEAQECLKELLFKIYPEV